MFVAYYNPHPFRAFHYSASTPYFFYPQCSLTLRIVSLVRHTGPRAGASPSFQKRIIKKVPESSSGRHFVCLSHTTIHIHFVHFIIPHQRLFLLPTTHVVFMYCPSFPSRHLPPLVVCPEKSLHRRGEKREINCFSKPCWLKTGY